MFERYTEKARRTIFFARYEASQTGSAYIEPEHLLLGLLREDKAFATAVLKLSVPDIEEFRGQLAPGREKVSTSVDLPLSHASKRALAYGAEDAERFRHEHIETGHLAIGILREDDPIAARYLKSRGIDLDTVRKAISGQAPDEVAAPESPGAAARLLAMLKRLRSDTDITREDDLREGRFSTTFTKEGVRIVRSHNYVRGHEVRVVERLQMVEDGKSLRYSIQIQGPGQEHRHEIEFPLIDGPLNAGPEPQA